MAPADSAPIVFGDAGLLANAADERSAYETAFAALRAGDYPASAGMFAEFLRLYPTGTYAPNATYWLGESYYVTQAYAAAQAQFEAILQRWPTHDKAPGALLKVGLSQYGQRDLVAAEATLVRVTEQYPGTDAARTADDRLRSIQLNSLRCIGLLRRLCDAGHVVSLETSGAIDIAGVDPRVSRVLDIKTPGSGEEARNLWSNVGLLTPHDQVKFVVCSRADYEWARGIVAGHALHERCDVLFSPSKSEVDARALADWIVEDRLPVRFQMQLHKLLWNDEPGR